MNDLLRKTRRAFHLLRELLKYETATCCAAVLKCWNKDYRHVWLVSERGREARDNGYHIFAYLNREHPELNSWFVADPTLPDYERVQALGRVVPYRSWKHYLLCAASEMKISTHVLGYTPEIDSYYMLDKLHVVHGPRRLFAAWGHHRRHEMVSLPQHPHRPFRLLPAKRTGFCRICLSLSSRYCQTAGSVPV